VFINTPIFSLPQIDFMIGWILFAVLALGGFVFVLTKYTKEPHE